jgi:hypothetical protein
MHRVNGYRGEFWGCPEYPQCKAQGGLTNRPPEAIEAERKARRVKSLVITQKRPLMIT